MKKLNKFIITTSKILEVVILLGMVFSFGALVYTIFGGQLFVKGIADDSIRMSIMELDCNGLEPQYVKRALIITFIFVFFICGMAGMIVRNINLIFRTTEGKTWFSKGSTPFQPDNIRMVREIGIFCIMIPVFSFIMSVVAGIALPVDMVEPEVDLALVFFGLVVLALSQYFAYGMELQNEVDGLV